MNDPGGFAYRDGHQLEQASGTVRADHEHPVLTGVLVLDNADRVLVGVKDVRFIDPMLEGRLEDLRM